MVAAVWAEPRPPTPGVSTNDNPSRSNRRGRPISTASSPRSLPGLPSSDAYTGSDEKSMASTSSVPPSVRRTTPAHGSSAWRMRVGTDVATSSSTGHTAAFRMALTSELLPCLNSPTTITRTAGSTSRSLVRFSRRARSSRP